jgi:hypothetical protein
MTEMIGIYPTMMITPYAEFWWLGVPAAPALVLHGLIAIVVGCALATWHAPIDRDLRNAVLALASLVVVPYCLNYDLAIPAAALLSWATRGAGALAPLTLAALGLFWFVPYVGSSRGCHCWPGFEGICARWRRTGVSHCGSLPSFDKTNCWPAVGQGDGDA